MIKPLPPLYNQTFSSCNYGCIDYLLDWLDTYFFRNLLSLPFQPLPVFWLLLAVAYVVYRRKKVKSARWLGGAALVWLLLISTSPVPNLLVASLEDFYPPLTEFPVPAGDSILFTDLSQD